MNETWYRVLRRLFDLIILLLFVIILVPDQWYGKSSALEDRPYERTEPMVKQLSLDTETLSETPQDAPQEAPQEALEAVPAKQLSVPHSPTAQVNSKLPIDLPKVAADSHESVIPASPDSSEIIVPSSSEDILDVPSQDNPPILETGNELDVAPIKIHKDELGNLELTPELVKKAAVPKPINKEVLWLQVGVFQNKEEANVFMTKLKNAKLPYQTEVLGKLTVLKVGPVPEGEVSRFTSKLKAAGVPNWVKTRQSK